jgi:hypothetical protein
LKSLGDAFALGLLLADGFELVPALQDQLVFVNRGGGGLEVGHEGAIG